MERVGQESDKRMKTVDMIELEMNEMCESLKRNSVMSWLGGFVSKGAELRGKGERFEKENEKVGERIELIRGEDEEIIVENFVEIGDLLREFKVFVATEL